MAEFNFDNLAKNLPDCYKKDKSSNNYKILEIERTAGGELRENLTRIANILDIENATGAVLDAYGERFGQPRGKATDQQYRIMIKSKIAKISSSGSYKDIVDVICFAFGCTNNDVLIEESTTKPMTVSLEQLPVSAINSSGFTANQAYQLIKSMMPIGVDLQSILFEGTFEFSDEEYEEDAEKGFSDVGAYPTDENYDSVIGGYLGMSASDATDDVLPI